MAVPNARSFNFVSIIQINWRYQYELKKHFLYFWVGRYIKTLNVWAHRKHRVSQGNALFPVGLIIKAMRQSWFKLFEVLCFDILLLNIHPARHKNKDFESSELIIKIIINALLDFSWDLMITLCKAMITTSIYNQGSDTKIPQARSLFYTYMELNIEISRGKASALRALLLEDSTLLQRYSSEQGESNVTYC